MGMSQRTFQVKKSARTLLCVLGKAPGVQSDGVFDEFVGTGGLRGLDSAALVLEAWPRPRRRGG